MAPKPPTPPGRAQSIVQPQPLRLAACLEKYHQPLYRKGKDLVAPLATATSFGGRWDPGDPPPTASGLNLVTHHEAPGISLPMPRSRYCKGTPFPNIPFGTPVEVTLGNRTINLPLVEVGPAGGLLSRAFVDITLGGWQMLLGRKVDEQEFRNMERVVAVRVIGGAKFLGDYEPFDYDVGTPGHAMPPV